jgi:hypothetical protein
VTGESDFGKKRRLSDQKHDRSDGGGKDRKQDEPGAYARTVVPPRAPARAVIGAAGFARCLGEVDWISVHRSPYVEPHRGRCSVLNTIALARAAGAPRGDMRMGEWETRLSTSARRSRFFQRQSRIGVGVEFHVYSIVA